MVKVRVPKHLEDSFQRSDMCKQCILKYNKAYEEGKCDRPFPLSCAGDRRLKADWVTDEERMKLWALTNPLTWAVHEFTNPDDPDESLNFRWYQSEIAGCTSRFKAIRAGRRTGKTFVSCLLILHAMVMKKTRIMVLTPNDSQIGEIFAAIDLLIRNSKMLKASVKTRTKHPDILELKNGSKIRGFCINSRSGTDPNKVRGQPADIIYVDEMDYIPEEDFKPVFAILAENPQTQLWATTTPCGLKQHFYFLCTELSRGYREFYYPATVSPNWTPQLEKMLRQMYSKVEYQHEVLAEWGDVEGGWYPAKAIDQSLSNYTWADCRRKDGCIYTLGVDWNDAGHGVHGIVLEYDPNTTMMTVVDKFIEQDPEFTQLMAIERIIGISRKWKVNLVWADSGYGSTQLESLRAYALRHPELKLVNKIRGVNMGQHEEIPDPWTGQKKKKRVKVLIADLTRRKIEENRCIFPVSEDEKGGLVDQIRSLQVVRYSQNGDPVFTDENDHTLTAWSVAMYALIMTYSDITKVFFTDTTTFAPSVIETPKGKVNVDTGSINMSDQMKSHYLADIKRQKFGSRELPSRAPDPVRRVIFKPSQSRGFGTGGRRSF